MHRLSALVGKPVIAADTGQKLGTVSDALVDDARLQLVGLVLGGGAFGKDHVLPFADILTLGADVVVARTASGVLDAREWRQTGPAATRSSSLGGKAVVTVTGRRVGTVSDVVVNDGGIFDALEVGNSAMGGLRTKRSVVRPSADMRIGPDAIVVPEAQEGTWEIIEDESDGKAGPAAEP